MQSRNFYVLDPIFNCFNLSRRLSGVPHTLRQLFMGVLLALTLVNSALAQQSGPAMAEVGISPPYLDLPMSAAQKTQSFRFFNINGKPTNVKVSVLPWTLTAEGKVEFLASSAESIDQWVVVNPSRFSTEAGKSQVVRFSVRPATELSTGEHRFMMIFEQEDQSSEETADAESEGMMQALFRLESAVYVQVGDSTRSAELSLLDSIPSQLRLGLKASGSANTRVIGQAAIYPAAQFPGAEKTKELPGVQNPDFVKPEPMLWTQIMPSAPVLPGSARELPLLIAPKLMPGRYVLDLNGTIGDAVLDRAFEFEIMPTP
jgi:hypothetical protein